MSETAANAGEQPRHGVRRRRQHARHLLERANQEVVVGAWLNLVAGVQELESPDA
jgi:hypothetical protein